MSYLLNRPGLKHPNLNYDFNNFIECTKDNEQYEIRIPDGFILEDFLIYTPVVSSSPQYSLNGALVLQKGVKLAGRQIVLGGAKNWLDEYSLRTLVFLAKDPNLEMDLFFKGERYRVTFDYSDKPIEAEPVNRALSGLGGILVHIYKESVFHRTTLRFLEISQNGN